ncbi:hypothetical protein KPL74_08905 [Bacillus sp. NP157]|nr:hypothetical protein KPL74_08905 [Bacillus sp. NP157]
MLAPGIWLYVEERPAAKVGNVGILAVSEWIVAPGPGGQSTRTLVGTRFWLYDGKQSVRAKPLFTVEDAELEAKRIDDDGGVGKHSAQFNKSKSDAWSPSIGTLLVSDDEIEFWDLPGPKRERIPGTDHGG